MNFPFVSRALYEREYARANAEHENAQVLRGLLVDQSSKYYALVRHITTPPAGLNLTTTMGATVVPTPAEPDPIAVVIREQAGRDERLAAHLRSYARDLKRQGKSQDEIIGLLVAWQTSEPNEGSA